MARGRPAIGMIRTGHAPSRSLDKNYAEINAERVNAFWRDRGFEVNARVDEPMFDGEVGCRFYPIVSDLVNGLPRALAERRAA